MTRTGRHEAAESGASLIIVTFVLIAILVIVGLVIDFGLARSDKQASKSAGDFATTAGLRGLATAGDGIPRPYEGVCDALRYLKANDPDFADLEGTLKPAQGPDPTSSTVPASGDPCQNLSDDQRNTECRASEDGGEIRSTWAWFEGTAAGGSIRVDIRSGYNLDDDDFGDESFALASDKGNPDLGNCDHLAVIISHTRSAGFGAVIGAGDLTTRTRSVGRVVIGTEGDAAVALVLLEQRKCKALETQGQASEVIVLGFGRQPGMIHADSDGSGTGPGTGGSCGSGQFVLESANDGGGNPLVRPLAAPDDGEIHGITSTFAHALGLTNDASWTNTRNDNRTHVWMCDPEVGLPVAFCETSPVGGDRLTRQPPDARYNRPVEVPGLQRLRADALAIANAVAAGTLDTYDHDPLNPEPPDSGRYLRYRSLGHECNNPNATITDAELPTKKLYVDCDDLSLGNNRTLIVTPADVEIVFSGSIKLTGGGVLQIDDPRRIYINNKNGDPNAISSTGRVDINRSGALDCAAKQANPSDRLRTAELVIRTGGINIQGGTGGGEQNETRLCSTFTHLMGGSTSVDPITDAPNYPAPFHNNQNGIVDVSGSASVQITAPNTVEEQPGLGDYVFEDLAIWTEASAHSGGSHRLGGSGKMNLVGIFVFPNADPLIVAGTGSGEIIADAQMWTRRLRRAGAASFTMRANPASSILVPFFQGFELVR